LGMFILSFVGLGVSMFPYIVPTSVTIYEAAAPRNAQIFMLVGASVLIPIILSYTAYAYWVFRGKVDVDSGYH
ncbi:MAG: cytochrome d ubiquinol oxidase subunit II, partial [Paracoccaceae bacterium]